MDPRTPTRPTVARAASLIAVLLAAVACGDDTRSDERTADAEASAPSTTIPVLPGGTPGACVNLDGCHASIAPATDLADGEVVQVQVVGWEPDAPVAIAQCVDGADPDNPPAPVGPDGLPPADVCNVLNSNSGPAATERSDAAGVVAFDYEVLSGPRMQAESSTGVCDAEHDCVLNLFVPHAGRFRSDAPIVTFPLRFA